MSLWLRCLSGEEMLCLSNMVEVLEMLPQFQIIVMMLCVLCWPIASCSVLTIQYCTPALEMDASDSGVTDGTVSAIRLDRSFLSRESNHERLAAVPQYWISHSYPSCEANGNACMVAVALPTNCLTDAGSLQPSSWIFPRVLMVPLTETLSWNPGTLGSGILVFDKQA